MRTTRGRLVEGVVYGPVRSRRFGVSLGLNLSGDGKHCSFNCPYCFRGFNEIGVAPASLASGLPSVDDVVEALERSLQRPEMATAVDWTFAGNAEPTDHPDFLPIVTAVRAVRDRLAPSVRLTVLSNGMGLVPRRNPRHAEVAAALAAVDRPCLKLDAGRPETWRRIARPVDGVTFDEWLPAAAAVPGPILQVMLVRGRIDNTTDDELEALAAAAGRLQPRDLQILTPTRATADPRLGAVPECELASLEARLRRLAGLPLSA